MRKSLHTRMHAYVQHAYMLAWNRIASQMSQTCDGSTTCMQALDTSNARRSQ